MRRLLHINWATFAHLFKIFRDFLDFHVSAGDEELLLLLKPRLEQQLALVVDDTSLHHEVLVGSLLVDELPSKRAGVERWRLGVTPTLVIHGLLRHPGAVVRHPDGLIIRARDHGHRRHLLPNFNYVLLVVIINLNITCRNFRIHGSVSI